MLNLVHFSDNKKIEITDRIGKISSLIKIFIKNFSAVYSPPIDIFDEMEMISLCLERFEIELHPRVEGYKIQLKLCFKRTLDRWLRSSKKQIKISCHGRL